MNKIVRNQSIINYQRDLKTNGTKSEVTKSDNYKKRDYFEMSEQGRVLFSMMKDLKKMGYDFNRLMDIHEKAYRQAPTKEENDYYWEARKASKELDLYLYERDRKETLEFLGQNQRILMKMNLNLPLTVDELDLIKDSPILDQEIKIQNKLVEILK